MLLCNGNRLSDLSAKPQSDSGHVIAVHVTIMIMLIMISKIIL